MPQNIEFPDFVWVKNTSSPALEVSIDLLPPDFEGRWLNVVRGFVADWIRRESFDGRATLWMWGTMSLNLVSKNLENSVPSWSEFIIEFGFPRRFLKSLEEHLARIFNGHAAITETVSAERSDGWAPVCHVEQHLAWRQEDADTWCPIDV